METPTLLSFTKASRLEDFRTVYTQLCPVRTGELLSNLVDIANSFVHYYQDLLGSYDMGRTSLKFYVVQKGSIVPESSHPLLCAPFSDAEIKKIYVFN